MARNWEHEAGKLWPVIVNAAKNRQLTYYSDVAPLMHTNALSVGKALEPIQAYCMDAKLPPLSAIVVNKLDGKPGGGFIAWDIDDIATANEKVFDYSWDLVENPFENFSHTDSTASLSKKLVEKPESAEAIYRKVKSRGIAQNIFRAALLSAYKSKCAICQTSIPEILEAAHIITWSDSTAKERISPNNGVLLCANHHKLFDKGYIGISEDLRVVLLKSSSQKNEADKLLIQMYQGKALSLPKQIELRPSIDLLRRRIQSSNTSGRD